LAIVEDVRSWLIGNPEFYVPGFERLRVPTVGDAGSLSLPS
jgi:hypothetical protein